MMKQKSFTRSLLFVLWLALVLGVAPAQATMPLAGQSRTPDGLSAADWAAIQSFLPSDYLKASNTGGGDQYGSAVAVDGDTVVVGAAGEGSNATGVNGNQANNSANASGAAYVFTRTGGVWSQQAYLKASNTGATDLFGAAVAIDGDTIIVGAYGEDSNATGVNGNQADNSADSAGAVYVFTRTAGVWSQQAYLKASNTELGDQFGVTVSVEGDTVVVGANNEDSNATGVNGNQADNSASLAGAAYVFTRTAGVWSQQAYLKASNTGAGDRFGRVAISGDTVVVGAGLEDSNATGVNGDQANNLAFASGAAYVFTRTAGVWSQQAYLKASNTGADDYFGGTVAVEGDTIVVGAYQEDSSATGINGDQANNLAAQSGAAYVFTRTAGVWSQQAYLKASNTGGGDWFGQDIAFSGDTIVVEAYGEDSNATGVNGNQADNSATNSGAAYVFTRTAGVWSQQAYLKASNTEGSDEFSSAVAVDGDTIVVGAIREDSNTTGINGSQANNSATDSGAAYIFHRCGVSVQSGAWEDTATWAGTTPPNDGDVCVDRGHTVTMNGNAAVHQVGVHPTGVLDLGNHTLSVEERVFNSGTLRQTQTVNNANIEFLHIQNAAQTASQYRGVWLDASLNGGNNLGNTTVSVQELNLGEYCTDLGVASVYRNTPIPSGFWVEQTTNASTGNDGGAYSYAQGEVAGFSPFLLGATGQSPTAVTLSNLTTRPASLWLWLVSGLVLLGGTAVGLRRRRVA
ncbi:MAG: FG-GAP repeat protein [Chloroflexi bacterium]|nr:FG-GAP repeat protein [Chloroflexota bacterium]